eukprot:14819160-Alexandrium_andersonii.AAC.1
MDVIELTSRAVVGLQQLWSGRLDHRLLAHDLVAEARGRSRAGRRVADRVRECVQQQQPPADRLRGSAALQRLRGSGASAPPA